VTPGGAASPTVDRGPVPTRSAARKNYAVAVTSPWHSPASDPSDPPATVGPDVTAELHIEGMHCASCVALIEESLTDRAGVTAASVDLDSARAVVHYDPSLVDPDDLRATIAEAGYSATMVG
jgi:Cu+-exporting ATPase